LFEPYTLNQLKNIPTSRKIVWNSRDLKTGGLKSETFEEARGIFKGWLCQASNIKTVKDIKEGADAVLVGTYLEEFARSIDKTSKEESSLEVPASRHTPELYL
jgi:hypothetical protein